MSRWSKKSEEEQKALLERQRELEKPKEVKREEADQRACMVALESGEIPLRCREHGWGGSDSYVIRMEDNILFGNIPMIIGTCRICKAQTRKAIQLTESSMMDAMMMIELQRQGRLVDERVPAKVKVTDPAFEKMLEGD